MLDLVPNRPHDTNNVIPDAIGYLKHLRFLRYGFKVTLLPRSLSKLYHLQFIICNTFKDCITDDIYPRDMNNLSNLRYVDYPRLIFSGVGKLKFLQKLNFCVENKIGYRIDELKHMNDLCILGICQLENVRDAIEACNAKLCYKRKLTNLSLDWCGPINVFDRRQYGQNSVRQNIVNPDIDERVFDKLQPHKYLTQLHISNYMGAKSAVWTNEAHLIDNLEVIKLSDCLEWQILPPFGHLPFLTILSLKKLPKVKRLDNKFPGNDKYCDFPSLEKLQISDLESLEDWFDAKVDCWFPWLTELVLNNCPNLQEAS